MKRPFVKPSYLFLGIILLIASITAITFSIFLEGRAIDFVGGFFLRYGSLLSKQNEDISPDTLQVVGKHADEFEDVLLVNKALPPGTKILSENMLVGTVLERGANTSKVLLSSSSGNKIEGVFLRSGIPASLLGEGAGVFDTKLPRGSDITVGDGIYQAVGYQILVGTVAKIIDEPSSEFLDVIVSVPINVTTLIKVYTDGT